MGRKNSKRFVRKKHLILNRKKTDIFMKAFTGIYEFLTKMYYNVKGNIRQNSIIISIKCRNDHLNKIIHSKNYIKT